MHEQTHLHYSEFFVDVAVTKLSKLLCALVVMLGEEPPATTVKEPVRMPLQEIARRGNVGMQPFESALPACDGFYNGCAARSPESGDLRE